jgi:hypothetical protein
MKYQKVPEPRDVAADYEGSCPPTNHSAEGHPCEFARALRIAFPPFPSVS